MTAPIRTSLDWTEPFDDIIDVRSPSEFADDHIPGALNLPVLYDAQRAEVGTAYKHISPFNARRMGAGMAAVNIAAYLDKVLADKSPTWSPLVYCWRGGKRSGAMAHIMAEIGWVVTLLDGGYKTYRNDVSTALDALALPLNIVLIQGRTGSAKTRILNHASVLGVQVIDLEGLAMHRGSLLGAEPQCPQPSQRMFESLLHQVMRRLDPARPVLIEAESSKIGDCHIPRGLWKMMTAAKLITINASLEARVDFLIHDYPHLMAEPERLNMLMDGMVSRHGHGATIAWRQLAQAKDWHGFVSALIDQHYDPAYSNTFSRKARQTLAELDATRLDSETIEKLAEEISAIFGRI